MCKHPAMRAPANGLEAPNSERKDIKPGISASANLISLRPHSARDISFTLYFIEVAVKLLIFDILSKDKFTLH
jgi:hypothetical protein